MPLAQSWACLQRRRAEHYIVVMRRYRVQFTRQQRFEAKISQADSGCWLWQGAKGPAGYGQFCYRDDEGFNRPVPTHLRKLAAGLLIDPDYDYDSSDADCIFQYAALNDLVYG